MALASLVKHSLYPHEKQVGDRKSNLCKIESLSLSNPFAECSIYGFLNFILIAWEMSVDTKAKKRNNRRRPLGARGGRIKDRSYRRPKKTYFQRY